MTILPSFFLALAQITDPRFRGVLWKGMGLTLVLFIAFFLFAFFGVARLVPDQATLPFIGEIGISNAILSWGSLAVMFFLSVFLMVPVASAFTGIFLDDVADAVEARHYPSLRAAAPVGLGDTLKETLGFLGIIILANALAFVLYFTPLAPFVFFGLNGYLLGREYFRMVAIRRVGRHEATGVYKRNFLTIWAAGILMALPLVIPVVNLLVPILGAATFTHIYHRIRGT